MLLLILFFLFFLFCLYVFSLRGRKKHPGLTALQGWNYAHRGLHDPSRPENSMAAFGAALEKGYGIELDVHLTKDGYLVVVHDSRLQRVTGRAGIVEEMTLAQLADYRLCSTQEGIPLFSQVLALFSGKAPMIVELKSYQGNHAELTDKAMAMLEGYKGVYCVESFDPRCVRHLKKHYPQVIRGQLSENFLKRDKSYPLLARLILTGLVSNFLTVPDFVAYRFSDRKCLSVFLARRLWGVQGVCWTLTSPDQHETALREGYLPIFEGYTP